LSLERRVLLRTATTKDAEMAVRVLAREGIAALACGSIDALKMEMARGAGALMLAEETLSARAIDRLEQALGEQPPWSDICAIVLSAKGADSSAVSQIMQRLPNVALIERPMRVASLVSAVRSTLRARERQYEVRSLLEELRKSDQRKTEFLATLAHELRNPLAPIRTALDLLSHPGFDAGQTSGYHALIRRQVDHMVRLVNDLMEASRITRGKISLRHEPVTIQSVLSDAVEQSRPLIEGARHRLVIDPSPTPLFVSGDPTRLTQVFCNLLTNAAKFTPMAGRIEVASFHDADKGHVVVTVSDTGTGLAPDALESIFEMFVQLGAPGSGAQGGLGIGLTLVKTIVELHGGSVHASSPGMGRGSTFTVRLPLLPGTQDSPPPRPADTEDLRSSPGRQVLVVDDNRDAADSLAKLLEVHGLRVNVAYCGEDALRLSADQAYDAALLDIGMSGMDGCELAGRLKALPELAQMKLIAITGWGQERDRRRLTAAGFDHHLLKPVNATELLRLL
jgi:signal transduction histidine kinase/CheY-like chemotaxis protein